MSNGSPAVVNKGGKSEEHFVTARYVPKGTNHCKIDQIALTEVTIIVAR